MTSVLFVDDHPIVLQGCRTVLQDLGVETIHEATSVVSGYRMFLRHEPDLVILDLNFEGDDLGGLTLVSRIAGARPGAKIVVFSMHNNPAIVARALENGASSYVLKDMPSTELGLAFLKVLKGEPYLSHDLAMQIAMLRAKGGRTAANELTARETQILTLLGQGASYSKIAAKLGISYKTVTNACSAMRGKLKLGSLAELIRFAIQQDPTRTSLGLASSAARELT